MQITKSYNTPLLKSRGLSTFHIEILCQVLLNKTNRKISLENGYSVKSHSVLDHSRKVMYKLLAIEGLTRSAYQDQVKHPRKYLFWWKNLLEKNKVQLDKIAICPEFY